MTLFIRTKTNKVRQRIEVCSFDEAKKQIKLHARENDSCYVQVASKMPMPEFRPMRYRAKVNEDTILRAENGRVLSKAEVRRMQGIGV
jgi:hypothetical protein